MNTVKGLILSFVLLSLALVGLAACGGETPPTATPLPPTSTPVPPTPTTAPTATAEAAAPGAATTTSSGSSSGAGTAATSADVALITESLTNTDQLKSYHFIVDLKPSDFITQPVHAEGDFVAPDKTYLKGNIGNQTLERLVIGSKVYVKDASGNWVENNPSATPTSTTSLFNPEDLVNSGSPAQGLSSFVQAGSNFRNVGTDTIDGVNTTHFTFELDPNKMMGTEAGGSSATQMPSIGGGSVWVDPSSKTVYRVAMDVDLGPIMQLLTNAFASLAGTPEPGTPTPTTQAIPPMKVNMTMDITKHNDSSISVPQPPQ